MWKEAHQCVSSFIPRPRTLVQARRAAGGDLLGGRTKLGCSCGNLRVLWAGAGHRSTRRTSSPHEADQTAAASGSPFAWNEHEVTSPPPALESREEVSPVPSDRCFLPSQTLTSYLCFPAVGEPISQRIHEVAKRSEHPIIDLRTAQMGQVLGASPGLASAWTLDRLNKAGKRRGQQPLPFS